jgi:hypothetical protein
MTSNKQQVTAKVIGHVNTVRPLAIGYPAVMALVHRRISGMLRRRSRLTVSRWSGLALLALAPLLTSCGSSSSANAGTTASGVPQPLHIAQSSYGPKPGMHVVGSPAQVLITIGQLASPGSRAGFSTVTFNVFLTNKGSVPFDCSALRAMVIPKKVDVMSGNGAAANAATCAHAGRRLTRADHTIASGSRGWASFVVANFGPPPKDFVVLPYGSKVGRMVWTVPAHGPTTPKTCFGRQAEFVS